MSPNVGNFVHDLVEMAKAMEELPKVERELADADRRVEELSQTVQDREIAIIGYKADIVELNNKVRSLEVERDDASFRVLEAEDQAHLLLDKARIAADGLEVMIALLDPPKPEPVKESEPSPLSSSTEILGQSEDGSTNASQGQSVSDPTSSQTGSSKDTHGEGSVPETVHSISEVSSGQSESSPTSVPIGETQASAGPSPVEQKDAGSNEVKQEGGAAEPTHGPYFGKRYINVEGYISRWDWNRGGGTDEDYDWRPAASRID